MLYETSCVAPYLPWSEQGSRGSLEGVLKWLGHDAYGYHVLVRTGVRPGSRLLSRDPISGLVRCPDFCYNRAACYVDTHGGFVRS